MTIIIEPEVEEAVDSESKIRAIGDSAKGFTTSTARVIGGGTRATGRKAKRLSVRVANSTVTGVRAVKRTIVKHGSSSVRTAASVAVAVVLFAFYCALVIAQLLFVMWLYAFFPLLFWTVMGVLAAHVVVGAVRFARTNDVVATA